VDLIAPLFLQSPRHGFLTVLYTPMAVFALFAILLFFVCVTDGAREVNAVYSGCNLVGTNFFKSGRDLINHFSLIYDSFTHRLRLPHFPSPN